MNMKGDPNLHFNCIVRDVGATEAIVDLLQDNGYEVLSYDIVDTECAGLRDLYELYGGNV